MSKLTKLILTVTILTFVLTSFAFADDEDTTTKNLVLYNTDGDINNDNAKETWIGFSSEGNSIKVTYGGNTLSKLLDDGYKVEYRKYDEFYSISDWISANDIISENLVTFPSEGFYQLRILRDDNLISTSDRILINVNPNIPIIIGTDLNNFDVCDFDGQSYLVTLKFNETLDLIDKDKKTSIDMELSNQSDKDNLTLPYFCTNFEYNNYSENVTIEDKEYTLNYSTITFCCNFSHYDLTNIDLDSYVVNYKMNIKNLAGTNTNKEPYYFYRINTYKDNLLNPKKIMTVESTYEILHIGEHACVYSAYNPDLDINIDPYSLKYISSDKTILNMYYRDKLKVFKAGSVYIYVKSPTTNQLFDYRKMTVDEQYVLTDISINEKNLTLYTGQKYQLTVSFIPENAINTDLYWVSRNSKCISVDENGIVTAKKPGTASIIATSWSNNEIQNLIKIKVVDPEVEDIEISEEDIPDEINIKDEFKLKAFIYPEEANQKVIWTSSNKDYAVIASDGTVRIKPTGADKDVTITATSKENNKIKDSITIHINKIDAKSINLKAYRTTVTAGKTLTLHAYVYPKNATNRDVKWKSSNVKYAQITDGIVTTTKKGKGKTVKITAISKDNTNIRETVKIKIK